MKKINLSLVVFTILFSMGTGCKKEISPDENADAASASASSLQAKMDMTITVHKGQSLKDIVAAAAPGLIIKVEPGTYAGPIVVTQKGITITGTSDDKHKEVIIDNPDGADDGIKVTGNNFTLKNVTVKNFKKNGVILEHVDGFLLSHVTAINDGEYGLFPVLSTNGVIEHCLASGHEDTGIYVGQSSKVEMNHNEAYGNTNGLEIENCSNVTVDKNNSHNNVAGFLLVLLPGLDVKELTNIVVTNNKVVDNNKLTLAPPGSGLESVVPSGSGILVVGAKNAMIKDNNVRGNNFTGIAVVSSVILDALAGIPPSAFNGMDPYSRNVHVTNNNVLNNGSNQPGPLGLPRVDLLWLPNQDGTDPSGNCWSKNKFTTSFPQPASLPVCN